MKSNKKNYIYMQKWSLLNVKGNKILKDKFLSP